MSADFGEVIVRSVQFTDNTGAAVAPDATPAYAVTLPDGTAGTPPTVFAGTLGEFFVNFVSPQAGRHEDTWTGAIGGLAAKFGPSVFHVRPAAVGPVVDIAAVRQHLTIRSPDPVRDEQLRDFLDAATELAEDFTGRTYRRQAFVETYDGGRDVIGLYQTPVQSVTSITENGATLPSTNYVVDLTSGTIQRGTLYGPGLLWLPGLQNITVAYVAGGRRCSRPGSGSPCLS
jgi:hypothetical protein